MYILVGLPLYTGTQYQMIMVKKGKNRSCWATIDVYVASLKGEDVYLDERREQ